MNYRMDLLTRACHQCLTTTLRENRPLRSSHMLPKRINREIASLTIVGRNLVKLQNTCQASFARTVRIAVLFTDFRAF